MWFSIDDYPKFIDECKGKRYRRCVIWKDNFKKAGFKTYKIDGRNWPKPHWLDEPEFTNFAMMWS